MYYISTNKIFVVIFKIRIFRH